MLKRLTLLVLAWLVAASTCFGASGTWRCANGVACAYSPRLGYHCPMTGASRNALPSTTAAAHKACPLCSARPAQPTSDNINTPCGLRCQGCQCRFVVVSAKSRALAPAASALAPLLQTDEILLPKASVLPAVYVTRRIVFTTGPPLPPRAHALLTTPSRAPPPRLLS